MIPTFKIGGVVFSATFTRFAAESMADLSGEFLCIVKLVDQWLKYKLPTQDVPWYVRAEVDKPAMVVAARYSQWISDRLRWEIPYWRRQDLQTAEKMSAYWPDEAAWYRVQQQAIEEPTVELTDEPPFPAALREIHHLRRLDNPAEKWAEQAEHVRAHRLNEANAMLAQLTEDITAHRFDTICETLEEVTGAIARSRTSHTDNLLEPVRALITWLRPSES